MGHSAYMASPSFGDLLRSSRVSAGLTQADLAGRAGVGVAGVRDLEQGRTRRPRPRVARALISALGVTGQSAAALWEVAVRADGVPAGGGGLGGGETSTGAVRIRVLGPLRVHRGSVEVNLGASKRRAVLGRLALSVNAPVAREELIDLLWKDRPPRAAVNAVQAYVSQLRAVFSAAGTVPAGRAALALVPGGYRLNLAEDQLDLAVFRRLVRQAADASTPPVQALDLLDAALELWQGDPFAGVVELRDHPLATALAEERITAVLRHADLAEAGGQQDRALRWLRESAARLALHEPLHARLITALAGSDLQAAALTAYADIRRRLADELGVDPGAELTEAHRRVLRQELPRRAGSGFGSGGDAADELPRPARLPADIGDFTGWQSALARLHRLCDCHLAGSPAAARDVWQQALAILDEFDESAAAVRAKLHRLHRLDLPGH